VLIPARNSLSSGHPEKVDACIDFAYDFARGGPNTPYSTQPHPILSAGYVSDKVIIYSDLRNALIGLKMLAIVRFHYRDHSNLSGY